MSERQSGGHEYEPAEQPVNEEVLAVRELTRAELVRSLQLLDNSFEAQALEPGNEVRYHTKSLPMPAIESRREALFYTLESIDQRMLSLLHPYLSPLNKKFSYYDQLTHDSRPMPLIDDGPERAMRQRLLSEDLRPYVENIERGLDLCEYQQYGRSKLAYLAIYPIYAETFGSWRSSKKDVRPWRDGETLNALMSVTPGIRIRELGLSDINESGILPLSEYKEND